MWCGAVRFSYYKTANCTTLCGVVHYYLWCGAVMPFCMWFLRSVWFVRFGEPPIDKDNAAHHHDNDKAHHSNRDKGKL